jgi:hypothetical protein
MKALKSSISAYGQSGPRLSVSKTSAIDPIVDLRPYALGQIVVGAVSLLCRGLGARDLNLRSVTIMKWWPAGAEADISVSPKSPFSSFRT